MESRIKMNTNEVKLNNVNVKPSWQLGSEGLGVLEPQKLVGPVSVSLQHTQKYLPHFTHTHTRKHSRELGLTHFCTGLESFILGKCHRCYTYVERSLTCFKLMASKKTQKEEEKKTRM